MVQKTFHLQSNSKFQPEIHFSALKIQSMWKVLQFMISNDSDEFLKQCETEASLKFNRCSSTEFAHLKNTYASKKLL